MRKENLGASQLRKPSSDHTVIISEAAKSLFVSRGLLERDKSQLQALPLFMQDSGDRQGQSSFLLRCVSKTFFSVTFKGQKKGGKSFTSLLREPLPSYQPRNAQWVLEEHSNSGSDPGDALNLSDREQLLRSMESDPTGHGVGGLYLKQVCAGDSQAHGSLRATDFHTRRQGHGGSGNIPPHLPAFYPHNSPQPPQGPRISSLRDYILGMKMGQYSKAQTLATPSK